MNICKNCGVELEQEMEYCPLCGQSVNSPLNTEQPRKPKEQFDFKNKIINDPQRKIIWEISSIILSLTIIINTSLNLIINKEISWSEYPVAICLIIFAYISLFVLWRTNKGLQIIGSFILASILLLALDWQTSGINWAIQLAIPILFFSNLILTILLLTIQALKQRGLIPISFSLLAGALICISTEAILDKYINNEIRLIWSLIVSACILPISAFLLYINFRLRKKDKLDKTFHI